nr:DUF3054 domain-containing protein [Leucobacter edaphi]
MAAVLDVALVVTFAAIGRGSHARAATAAGLFETAWPFLAGLAVVWLAGRVWRNPFAVVSTGIVVWIGTVALGQLFRLLSGGTTATAFIIVSAVTLGAFLVGWRLIAMLIRRLRRRGA